MEMKMKMKMRMKMKMKTKIIMKRQSAPVGVVGDAHEHPHRIAFLRHSGHPKTLRPKYSHVAPRAPIGTLEASITGGLCLSGNLLPCISFRLCPSKPHTIDLKREMPGKTPITLALPSSALGAVCVSFKPCAQSQIGQQGQRLCTTMWVGSQAFNL